MAEEQAALARLAHPVHPWRLGANVQTPLRSGLYAGAGSGAGASRDLLPNDAREPVPKRSAPAEQDQGALLEGLRARAHEGRTRLDGPALGLPLKPVEKPAQRDGGQSSRRNQLE